MNKNKSVESTLNNNTNNSLSNVIEFKEKVDLFRVKHILSMKDNELIEYYNIHINENDSDSIDVKDMKVQIYNARKLCSGYLKINNDEMKREYKSKDGKRHYLVGSTGLQILPSFIRNYLGNKLYDHDITNSHPTIMLYLSSKVSGLENTKLREYVENREKILVKNNIDKNTILSLINMDNPKPSKNSWLRDFVEEVKIIKDVLLNTIKHNFKPNTENKSNPKSSVFAQILHKYETKVMTLVYDKYTNDISVPMYDGFLSHKPIPIDELNELTSKYGVKWKHKSIDTCIKQPESINDLAVRDYYFLKFKWQNEISFISSQGVYIVNATRIMMNHQTITQYAANWICPNIETNKMEKFLPQWLSDVDRFCYDIMDFIPYNKDIENDPTPKNIYNTFIPFDREKIDDYDNQIPPIFKEYLEKGYNDETKINYLIKYLAHLIQRPQELPEVILVLRGLEGAGKDSLIKLITSLIGIRYIYSTEDTEPVFGNFNGSISGKLIVQLNELDQKKFIPIAEGLKDYSTREYNNINEKYMNPREEKNRVRIIAISNHNDPVLPSATDRRYIVLLLHDQLVNNRQFWDKFYIWIKDKDEMNKLYTYLLNYDISNWHPKDRLITNELRLAQYNNIQPYIKYLYITLCSNKELEDPYIKLTNGECKILKKDMSIELSNYYKEVDYGFKKKKVNEYLMSMTGLTSKQCSKSGYYWLINIEKLKNTLLNANGLKDFLDFFKVDDSPF